MRIKLSDERRDALLVAIRDYFHTQHDDDIGELKASLVLDFFVERLGPPIYNQAINDAYKFIQDKLIDLQGEFYEPENDR